MFVRQIAKACTVLFKIHVLKQRVPLFASWNLTFRCNLACKYCATHTIRSAELSGPEVIEGLDALWDLGVRWVTFGGGEPLIRNDITDILRYAKSKGFQAFLSTNGWLAPERTDALEYVDHVNISLDGGRDVHDAVRGEGAFDKAVAAVDLCTGLGIDVSLLCVLSKVNLDSVSQVLDIASAHHVPVMFQPATQWLNTSGETNPIAPPVDAYRKTIENLIGLKKGGAPIRNSVAGLRHLAKWPDPAPIWCAAGVLISVIEPDGSVLACHQCQNSRLKEDTPLNATVADGFRDMVVPKPCAQCWCAPIVELALMFSLRPGAVLNGLRMSAR